MANAEHILRQARSVCHFNGQATVANMKHLLTQCGLTPSGPKEELVHRIYENRGHIRMALALHSDEGDTLETHEADVFQDEEDLVCDKCRSGDTDDGNEIILCDGDHSDSFGMHQLCLNPPLTIVPLGDWLCPECVRTHDSAERASKNDATFAPNIVTKYCSDSNSEESYSSDSGSGSSSGSGSESSESSECSDSSSGRSPPKKRLKSQPSSSVQVPKPP